MALISQYIKTVATPMEGCHLGVLQSVLGQIDEGKLDFYEKAPAFNVSVKMNDFNLLKLDTLMYNKINLPFQVTVVNNTFMKTRIFRLVSRKIPNTINQFSNITLPFDVEIGESQSFLLYVSIDSFDDVDWLINNDLAFLLYSDNTTLSEIDFAIRCPDIRGITSFKKTDTTLDLDDQYLTGLTEFEDLIPKALKLDDEARIYAKLREFSIATDISPDSTYGQAATEALLTDIQENNKLKDLKNVGYPSDFVHNVINIRDSKTFRDKFRFNVLRFTYVGGITERTMDVRFDDARTLFNIQKAENASNIAYNLEHTDVTSQRNNLDGLIFMVRIPFYGSIYMYLDLVFYVINIKNVVQHTFDELPLREFVGDFIRLGAVFSDEPILQDIGLSYDISSQVKENLTTFQSIEAPNYGINPTDTHSVGYKFLSHNINIDMSSIINASDITISYYHTNPILCYKKNWVVFEHSEIFRDAMLAYDWYDYFGISTSERFPDNSINLYNVDYTLERWLYDISTGDQTNTGEIEIINNQIFIGLSNVIKNSFKVLSMNNVSNASSSMLLTDVTKDLDMIYIDKVELFNNGNTFLNITGVNIFYPNGKYEYWDRQVKEWGSDAINDQIPVDADFYSSLFDREEPVQIMSFNSLTPGETGDIYIAYKLNRAMLTPLLQNFFKIPIYIRIEFNSGLSLFICHSSTEEFSAIAKYNNYVFGSSIRDKIGHSYPYYQQMFNERDLDRPPDAQKGYAHTNTIIELDNIYQKSQFHHDLAQWSDATVFSNKLSNTYVDMKNSEPYSYGVFSDGKMTPFSQLFTIPVPRNTGKINSFDDLLSIYNYVSPSEMTYKFYIMKFDIFFKQMIEDIKNKYYLVSLIYSTKDQSDAETDKVIYLSYDISNEYQWYNYVIDSLERGTTPINLSWLSKYTANITLNMPETKTNIFQFGIPRALEYVDVYGFSQDMFGSILSGSEPDQLLTDLVSGKSLTEAQTRELAGKGERQYFGDRFQHTIDFGKIVGNKPMTMAVDTDYFNLFRIKSYSNLEISNQSIGPGLPDVYSMKIIDPTLEHAGVIFEFFKYDYTFDMVQEHQLEPTLADNAGNYIVSPSYFNLEYLPIDETYTVMCKITNQNPYSADLTVLARDTETNNAIQLVSFPDNEEFNKIYLSLVTLNQPYSMLPNEEVKVFFRIIPRRIGMNFFTVYLKINNAIRPVDFEFRSFINKKAYFVLDSASRTIDFGDVPIGKYVEEGVVVKNIGNVLGKINSIYTFGNDAKYFKVLDRDTGNVISERLSYNKVVQPKTSIAIPVRFYSQSYGFNYSYCYIETNEPVLEDAQWIESDDYTQLYRNAPKYLVSLLKANSVIEDDIIQTDSYIFLGYVNPLKSKFRNYEIPISNKNRNKIVSIFKVTNLMKNYVNIKYNREPFAKDSSIYIQLNPRGYTEGWYYDQIFIQMIVYDKNTKKSKFVLNKIPVSWYVTREQRLSFDVDLEEIIFSTKPFLKAYKKIHVRNFSNEDATLFTNLLTDHSGLYTIVPDLGNEEVIIPEGVTFTFLLTFGGDQRFIGAYDTMLTVRLSLGGEDITKYIPVKGIVGDENIVKFYRRSRITVS